MPRNPVPTIAFRRKREQKTNYKKRLTYLKSRTLRLVVRKSLQNMTLQLVEYHADGDKVVAQVQSAHLKKYGMDVVNGNIPCAYLTGFLLGVKAKQAGIATAIVDLGLQSPQAKTRIFAAIKGVNDGGLKVPMDESAAPPQDRLEGKHIAANTATTFTRYKNVKEYPALVAAVKQKIQKS